MNKYIYSYLALRFQLSLSWHKETHPCEALAQQFYAEKLALKKDR